jgi:hypothetical protein
LWPVDPQFVALKTQTCGDVRQVWSEEIQRDGDEKPDSHHTRITLAQFTTTQNKAITPQQTTTRLLKTKPLHRNTQQDKQKTPCRAVSVDRKTISL